MGPAKMTNKSDFNFRKSDLEQTGTVYNASDSLKKLGEQAGKAMSAELANGNTPEAMYLANTSQAIARSASQIAGHVQASRHGTHNNETVGHRPRVK
jgi:hypothetical protein